MDFPRELYKDGSCVGVDPDLFDERSATFDEAEAKRICAACNVSKMCLQIATELPGALGENRHYIWGGMTELERQQLAIVG